MHRPRVTKPASQITQAGRLVVMVSHTGHAVAALFAPSTMGNSKSGAATNHPFIRGASL